MTATVMSCMASTKDARKTDTSLMFGLACSFALAYKFERSLSVQDKANLDDSFADYRRKARKRRNYYCESATVTT